MGTVNPNPQKAKEAQLEASPLGRRVRDLLMIAMTRAPQPVPEECFIELRKVCDLIDRQETRCNQLERVTKALHSRCQALNLQIKTARPVPEVPKPVQYGEPFWNNPDLPSNRKCKACHLRVKIGNFFYRDLCFSCTPPDAQMRNYRRWEELEKLKTEERKTS